MQSRDNVLKLVNCLRGLSTESSSGPQALREALTAQGIDPDDGDLETAGLVNWVIGRLDSSPGVSPARRFPNRHHRDRMGGMMIQRN